MHTAATQLITHCTPRRIGLMIAITGVMLSGLNADAALQVTEKGEAAAAIVHNGHEAPAKELAVYLKKITGAALPLAETADDAGKQAVIELRLVDKVPGASEKRTADHAYRLTTDRKSVV